jgi:twitching motility protein PilT
MIDHINRTKKGHILTIEDPVEFQHERIKSLISQREVKAHTKSFAHALHSALREDPDVILVGEMRDAETIGIAVTAAETGILVMGTLHTNSASATIDRIINVFPTSEQNQIRTMLSTSLRGVISQQLLPRASGTGRVAALEILINNSAIGNMIRQGKTDQINNAIQSGKRYGMQSMDGALKKYLDEGLITGEQAYMNAFNKATFTEHAPSNEPTDD